MNKEKVKLLLSESSQSSDSEEEDFHVNENYASKYDKWRHKEEFQKLKAKYGDSSPSSSSSSESEEETALTPVIEKDFLKTLSLLKSKDPKIYDENQNFFTNVTEDEEKPKLKKTKPLYLKDYERKRLLEKSASGKLDSDNDDEGSFSKSDIRSNVSQTYDEEQMKIKESFKRVLADSDSEEGETDLFQIRKKDQAEKEKDEADYIQWLKGEKDLPKEKADEDLEYLHKYWNNPDIDNDEEFLRNYILNKEYMENDEIPTYDEITNDVNTLSDDENILKNQEVFEHKYNFRFEEPDTEFIKQYPRTIGDSLRRVDSKRKLQRENYQERKKREKEQKKEEIKRLKYLKRIEIEDMLKKLKETTGNDELGFEYTDIDKDFDPDEHDKRMKELFNDDYYKVDENDKPQFPSDEEIDCETNWDNWTGNYGENKDSDEGIPHCEDAGFNMDADYDPKQEFQKKMLDSHTKKGKKKRRRSKFAEALSQPKPVFDSNEKSLEQYIDDYYKLDFEDVIGGEIFRFKYRNVVPNDFGLSTDEILKARDKELNKWCSLKKTCQHRADQEEMYDVVAYRRKAENPLTKKKVLPSLFENSESETSLSVTLSNENKKKRKTVPKDNNLSDYDNVEDNYDSAKRIKVEKDVNDEQINVEKDVKQIKVEKDVKQIKVEKDVKQIKVENDVSATSEYSPKVNAESNNLEQNSPVSKNKHKKRKKKKSKTFNNNEMIEHSNVSAVPINEDTEGNSHNNFNPNTLKKKKKRKKTFMADDFSKMQNSNSTFSESFNKKLHTQKKSVKTNNSNSQSFSEKEDKRLQLSDARLKAYGINPKKFKNRIKYGAINKVT